MKKDLSVSTTDLYIGMKKYSSIFVLAHVRDKKYKIYKSNFNTSRTYIFDNMINLVLDKKDFNFAK